MVAASRIALDTNVAILLTKGHWQTAQAVAGYQEILLPTVVAGELLFGAHNSGRVATNLPRERAFIAGFVLLDVTVTAAEHYVEIRFALKQQGQPIPENDLWIAAICRASSVPLFTLDAHFQRVPGLQVLQ